MKPKSILRTGSIITFLQALAHTSAFSMWKQPDDPIVSGVIKQMIESKFLIMGTMRSLADIHDGLGYTLSIDLCFIGIVMWFTSGSLEQDGRFRRSIILACSFVLLGWSIIQIVFFFPLAVAFSLAASLLGFYSIVLLNKEKRV
jgi:hypothetical protein